MIEATVLRTTSNFLQTQQNSILRARRLLNTDQAKARVDGLERTEPGVNGSELVTYVHPGATKSHSKLCLP